MEVDRTPVPSDVGFADGEVTGYATRDDRLSVAVRAWNGERLVVAFSEPLGVRDRGVASIQDVCEVAGETPLLAEVLAYHYESVPDDHGLRVFQFLDLDGEPSLEVVARDVVVERDAR